MIEYDGEKYITATEVEKHFKISRNTCRSNVLSALAECYLPGKRRSVYRLVEGEELSQVCTIEKQVHPLTLVKQDENSRIRREAC